MAKATKGAKTTKTIPVLNEETGRFEEFQPASDKENESDPALSGANADLDLAGFDYKNLTGEKFKEYVRLVGDRSYQEKNDEGKYEPVNGSLLQEDKYDFILLPAKPVMVERFPGMKDTPIDYIGIKAKDTDPIHTTRIPVRTALEYNAQIINQHSRAGHGKYYFLKKN